MARSDLLVNLVRAGVNGDRGTFRKTVNAIVAEERAKQHNVVADQLERVVNSAQVTPIHGGVTVGEPANRAKDFIMEVTPHRKLAELVLPEITQSAVGQVIEEQQRATVLRSHGLEPRHRLLFVGPPGNGKTTLAEALAEGIGVPLFVVRYDAMIGSFLGETASRLKRVFDYVCSVPCVLFFDEFDTVGKERGDKHDTGEIKRVVTSLLMQIDTLPSYVVVVAATNHAELLDRAVWRRFQVRLTLPKPSAKQLGAFISHTANKVGMELGATPTSLVKMLGAVSYSEAEEFILNLARRQTLALGEGKPAEIIRHQLRLWRGRARGPVTE